MTREEIRAFEEMAENTLNRYNFLIDKYKKEKVADWQPFFLCTCLIISNRGSSKERRFVVRDHGS